MSLEAQLAQLENAQLVGRASDGDPAYSFKHALTPETAYNLLLVKKRREIHRLVADTCEQLYPNRLDKNGAHLRVSGLADEWEGAQRMSLLQQ